MKTFIMVFFALLVMLFFQTSYAAPQKMQATFKHKVQLNDINTTAIGSGSTKSQSFANAAKDCFNKRVQAYETHRGSISEDKALDIIDSCANIPY